MKMLSPVVLGLSLAVAGSTLSAAQSTPSTFKILQVVREDTKPYKGGAAHDKTESAFVQAMIKSKFPAHYICLNSMSGKSRSLYLTIYDSFAEWEKDNQIVEKNAALSAELERDSIADGELLDQVRGRMTTEERQIADLRGQGLSWPEIAAHVGGTAEARRKQLTRTLDLIARQLGIDEADDAAA